MAYFSRMRRGSTARAMSSRKEQSGKQNADVKIFSEKGSPHTLGDDLLADGGEASNTTNKGDDLLDGGGEGVGTEATGKLDAGLLVLEQVENAAHDLFSAVDGSIDAKEIASEGSILDSHARELGDEVDNALTVLSGGSDDGGDLLVGEVVSILGVLGIRDGPEAILELLTRLRRDLENESEKQSRVLELGVVLIKIQFHVRLAIQKIFSHRNHRKVQQIAPNGDHPA
jgi:hypothetical protein